ncbi:MAG: hypothetical protein KDB22_06710 [Planctomycetales bacterium]|nr:hypothetical protein [Planctomycetales bacterium]
MNYSSLPTRALATATIRSTVYRAVVLTGLLFGPWMQTAVGQIVVLSEGDPSVAWLDAQTEHIESQLADTSVQDELRLELESQRKWLRAWQPGSLSDRALWQTKSKKRLGSEPSLDPNRSASALRRQLLGPGARPTARDTSQLERLLKENHEDLGIRQLHLHWLDQDQYRKAYCVEIAQSAQRVYDMIDKLPRQDDQTRLAAIYCAYRRARALAYRELPEVIAKRPIQNPDEFQTQLLSAYELLRSLAGPQAAEFILLDVRMLRRDHWNGTALCLLEDHADVIDRKWYLKKRRDILRDLHWTFPADEAAAIYAQSFPEEAAAEEQL